MLIFEVPVLLILLILPVTFNIFTEVPVYFNIFKNINIIIVQKIIQIQFDKITSVVLIFKWNLLFAVSHPGLLTLWNSGDESLHDSKWKLFATSVSSRLNVDKLRNLPAFLVIPTAALYYLKEVSLWDVCRYVYTKFYLSLQLYLLVQYRGQISDFFKPL